MKNLTFACKYHTPTTSSRQAACPFKQQFLIRPPTPSESTLARDTKQGRKTDSTGVSWELGGPLQRK
jgi:hypothetical protein